MLTLSSKQKHNLLLVTVIVIGILLRVYSFPSPPPGLNQTVAKFLIDNHQNNLGIIAFVPWAFGLYSYATSYFVIPPLLLLVIIRYSKLFCRT